LAKLWPNFLHQRHAPQDHVRSKWLPLKSIILLSRRQNRCRQSCGQSVPTENLRQNPFIADQEVSLISAVRFVALVRDGDLDAMIRAATKIYMASIEWRQLMLDPPQAPDVQSRLDALKRIRNTTFARWLRRNGGFSTGIVRGSDGKGDRSLRSDNLRDHRRQNALIVQSA
jgi:hypothetical protein